MTNPSSPAAKGTPQNGNPNVPQQGLIQEVAIGDILSNQLITENQIKKG